MGTAPNYIENLVFKLNHELNTPPCEGSELTEVCSKFSGFEAEVITSLLKSFVKNLKTKTRIEKNLLAQKFIQEIIYSPKSIKIALFYRQNANSDSQNKLALPEQGDGIFSPEKEASLLASENKKFASFNTGSPLHTIFEPL